MGDAKTLQLLSVKTNQDILKILGRPKTVMEVFREIRETNEFSVKNRESIYRALERLVDVKLVKKYYSETKKGFYYSRKFTELIYDIKTGEIKMK